MLLLSVLLPFFASVLATVAGSDTYTPFQKALTTCARDLQTCPHRLANYRSLKFLDDRETHCFVLCVLTELRAWSHENTTVKHAVLQQYFQPDVVDYDNLQRTRRCVEKSVAKYNATDSCGRAYGSFTCYVQQFGTFVPSLEQFVPPTEMELVQNVFYCMDSLQVPRELLGKILSGEEDRPCLNRCFVLRSQTYTDEQGFNLDKLYVLIGFNDEKQAFVESAQKLLEGVVVDQPMDKCAVAKQRELLFHDRINLIFGPDGPKEPTYIFNLNRV